MSAARGNFKMALSSVRTNKGRSLLTMAGVVIGIVAFVTVVGLGDGIKQQVTKQVDQYGADLITIRPGKVRRVSTREALANADLLFGLNDMSGLSPRDLNAVQTAAHVNVAAPLGVISGSVQATTGPTSNATLSNALVIATNANLPAALHQGLSAGSFFAPGTNNAYVAVLGKHAANALFQQDAPLGNTFTFRGQAFVVTGVFNDFAATPLAGTADFNDAIFIPDSTAEQLSQNQTEFYTILAKPKTPGETQAAITAVTANISAARHGAQDFSVLDQQQNIAASSDVLNLLTTLISAVAAIALLLGGVGIMNIMLVSVTERMHEIGVRKAVGATNRQVLGQFTLEALVLGGIGGLLGVATSAILAVCLRTYTSYKPTIAWQAMIVAALVSLAIGVISGAAPAFKAARKDPVEALRHE